MFGEVHATITHPMASRTPRSNFYLPKPNISLYKNSFAYDAAKLFNALPLSVKQAITYLYPNPYI